MTKTGERARRNTIGSTPTRTPKQTHEIVKPTRKSLRNPTHKDTCIKPTCNTKDARAPNAIMETDVELEQPQKIVKSTRKPKRKFDWRKRVAPKAKMTKQPELKEPQKETCDDNVITIEDDGLLEPKLEDSVPLQKFSVQGYEVKRRYGTILEAIFNKHNDIAANCIFKTPSARTYFLELVCEVVRQIQAGNVYEKMEELMCRVSDAEAASVDVTWLRAHLEAIKRRNETSEKCTLLMDASLAIKAAQKDKRERHEELEVAQQRFETADKFVRVLLLVEESLSDQILKSKSELDAWVNGPVI